MPDTDPPHSDRPERSADSATGQGAGGQGAAPADEAQPEAEARLPQGAEPASEPAQAPTTGEPAPSTTAAPGGPTPLRSAMRTVGLTVLAVVVVVGLYLVLAPSPIDPAAYDPPPKPAMTGALAPNDALLQAELLAVGKIDGPEDVDVDAAGRVYGGTNDGKIVRVLPDGTIETFAETGGRPLGLHFDSEGHLVVADADKGLLRVDPQGNVTTLASEAGGVPFGFADDLDIGRDGVVYFSDASSKFGKDEYLYDLLEARPHGRLLAYDPRTGETEVLLDGLYFANGVALSQQGDFVLVNETYRYRITRYWLEGPKAGTSDTFIDNLPGFPDGVSSNRRGTFWLALFTVRNDTVDWLHARPWLKAVMAKLPRLFWPQPEPYGLVLALDEQGRITRSLHEPTATHLWEITSAQEHDGHLYLGSLDNDRIGRLELDGAAPALD
ncbi:MAG: SMP-30/gluconolactonase/LRE family protein [Pirellulales bacterium]